MKYCILVFIVIGVLFSCKKEDSSGCNTKLYLKASSLGPYYEGSQIKFDISTTTDTKVQISGPNGYYHEFVTEDEENTFIIDTARLEHSGNYQIKGLKDCKVESDYIDFTVLPVPSPTCDLEENVIEHDLTGIYDSTYQYVYGHTLQGKYYEIYGINNSHSRRFNIVFYGTSRPRPGKYRATGMENPGLFNYCGVEVKGSSHSYFMQEDDYFIVEEESGKLIITICSATFIREYDGSQGTVSAKLVLN